MPRKPQRDDAAVARLGRAVRCVGWNPVIKAIRVLETLVEVREVRRDARQEAARIRDRFRRGLAAPPPGRGPGGA